MDDELNQRLAREKGDKAKAFLESSVWTEAWEDYEAFIFEQFRKTESTDTEKLAHWKRMHVAGLAFKSFFERTVQDGEFAQKDLEFKKQGLFKLFK